MRALHAIERRLQDIQRQIENKERLGKIVAVKYEKDRWYVKMNDGEDETPSGSGSGGDAMAGGGTFKSDWQPWQSSSHATMKYSNPPKVGQHALLRSVGGMAELSTVEPFHYGPQTPSPHGKQDESVSLIHEKDDQQHWHHQTKDINHVIIKTKKKQGGGIPGLGDIGGLTDMAGIAQMAGFSGMDFSSMLGGLGGLDLGSLGNLANLDISNMANLSQITSQLGGIGDLTQLANFGAMANLSGLPQLAQLGNIAGIAQQVKGANLVGAAGQMIGGGMGGSAGVPKSLGGKDKEEAPKLPEIPEEGEEGVTQVKSTKEFILKTVGKNKSYFRQDENKVHVRYGEDKAKADILMDENQVKIQFKDKKAVVTWKEDQLNVTFGEDRANIQLTDEEIVITQGKDASRVMIQEDYIEVKGATQCAVGVDGRWININQARVNLGVGGPKEQALAKVMTVAGPSERVWANIG